MWKQDIGQWVERKGRRGWVKQQQQQQQSSAPPSPARRVGFLPEGFEDRHEDVTLMPDMAANAAHPSGASDNAAAPAPAGERWVAVYGASPGSIMEVREFLDVMFGRTVAHYYPMAYASAGSSELTPTLAGGQNWFYVKFEDPISAARAVYQSPLTISVGGGRGAASAAAGGAGPAAREEVVGVTWCTDGHFLRREREAEQRQREPPHPRGGSTDSHRSHPRRAADGVENAAGVTPRGAERLHRAQPPPSLSEAESGGRASRGLGTLLYDALCSPWRGRWTATPSRDHSSPDIAASTSSGSLASSSSTHTEAFHEDRGAAHGDDGGGGGGAAAEAAEAASATGDFTVPSCLRARKERRHHYDAERQLHGAIPVRPLRGNESVLCVLRADAAERRLLRRVVLAIARLPSRISRLLVSPALRHEDLNAAVDAADDSQWLSTLGGLVVDRRSGQRRQLLRNRHYNAAARLHGVSGGYGEASVIAAWTPCRWYERASVTSLLACLFLILLVFFSGVWGGGASVIEDAATGRWGNDTAAAATVVADAAYDGGKYAAPRLGAGQLQGTMFADGIHGSDRYKARTL
ncbi:uncharacterized protein Tco025E_00960 [Trypanosoma conorhini]|uniref:RRM domain-containing protein n=1 Tax=Trypanosoma conorhini TaxID=83891 RepID=A0A3R7NTI4_9TRYP|nr:uncharacterized protein Tco025E_00960 [Trypanosoma conorhini]RNF26804.1 hypothetical protein Tco025E_00960 [Trypanosoma conorhini]